MSFLLSPSETHLKKLVAHIVQRSSATSVKIMPEELENPEISHRLATAVGGTGYGAFRDGLHAVSSHKGGSRGTPSSPSTSGLFSLTQSGSVNFTSLLLWPWFPVWT